MLAHLRVRHLALPYRRTERLPTAGVGNGALRRRRACGRLAAQLLVGRRARRLLDSEDVGAALRLRWLPLALARDECVRPAGEGVERIGPLVLRQIDRERDGRGAQ